jgi:hypothetical protein
VTDPTAKELAEAIEHVASYLSETSCPDDDLVLGAARRELARLRAPAAGAPSEAVARAREALDEVMSVRNRGPWLSRAGASELICQAVTRARAALDELEAHVKGERQ